MFEEVDVTLDASTMLLVRDLLKGWVDATEGQREIPFYAMRDFHRIAAIVGYPV